MAGSRYVPRHAAGLPRLTAACLSCGDPFTKVTESSTVCYSCLHDTQPIHAIRTGKAGKPSFWRRFLAAVSRW
jgi:hypothetical protein